VYIHVYDQIKVNEMGRACSIYGGEEECLQGLVSKPEGRTPFGRPRHRWRIILTWSLKKLVGGCVLD
jgi:hypothetical protein